MPMIVPKAVVIEDFSQPLVQSDGSAIVKISTYVDGKEVAFRNARLSALEMQGIADSPSIEGMSVGNVIGMNVLQMLSKRGDIKGTFPTDYVTYTAEPAPTKAEPESVVIVETPSETVVESK